MTKARFPSFAKFDVFEKDVTKDSTNYYDAVCLDHVLQQTTRTSAKELIGKLRKMLKSDGELIVVTPSLDWACAEIAKNDPAPIMAYITLYGYDQVPYLCGFTLSWLRTLVQTSGFLIISATLEKYMSVVQGRQEEALQNVVVAIRTESEYDDPAQAIG